MAGILLVMPALTIIAIFVTLFSGGLISVWQLGLPAETFVHFTMDPITVLDFLYCILKSGIFGLIICTVSCWNGFNCEQGSSGVGEATNKAVVSSAVICVVNFFLSQMLYN